MSYVIVTALFAAALFTASYVTRRRFGVLGLSLIAGATLSSLWINEATPLVASAGIELVKPPLRSVVAVVITLLPAFILFFSGQSTKGFYQRFIGSLAFALLGTALLLEPFSSALVIDAAGQPVYNFLEQYQRVIITAGILLAIADLLMKKPTSLPKEGKH